MTRKAFVGLAGPVFYDYQNLASKTQEDTYSSPNPILDSPAALILLYDEIWFLSRSLCPQSMRNLDFVRFLLEDSTTSNLLSDFQYDEDGDTEFLGGINQYQRKFFFDNYDMHVFDAGAHWWKTPKAAIDNHTHTINLGAVGQRSANSIRIESGLLDQAILNHIGGDFELVINKFQQQVLFPTSVGTTLGSDVSLPDALVFPGLTARLTPNGPDTDLLGEIRDHGTLHEFRKWISKFDSRVSTSELRTIEAEVNDAIQSHYRKLWDKFNPATFHTSISKTVLTEGIGFIHPIFGKAAKAAKTFAEYKELKSGRWSAFLGRARHITSTQKSLK